MNPVKLDGQDVFPSKIVCIGLNYVEHIRELDSAMPDEPVIFMKPNSSISGEIRASQNHLLHYEGEISFMVWAGKLAAVGFGLDLTRREIQSRLKKKGHPWERSKGFDGSAVFSNFVSFNGEIDELEMELSINGKLVQRGGCDLMLYKPARILREASSFLTFEDGDLLMSGTPKGVGPVITGDEFTGRIFAKDKLLLEKTWVVK